MATGSASSDHDMYHVPQQSRREKLRFSQEDGIFAANHHNFGFCSMTPGQQIPFSLSLSSSSNQAGTHQQLGPFTGYAEILSRSRFLGPARELLEEICCAGGVVVNNKCTADPMTEEVTRGRRDERMVVVQQQGSGKKNRLISMIDEVYQRYKLYYQQVQAVITSFESVPGLSSAAPYASMALKVMSKHFKCLKKAMSDQLDHINNGTVGKEGEESSGFGLTSRAANINYSTVRNPHIWRPQRGLPERAVAVLRAWLFEHFLHPYPTDTDKQILAKQTGLTRNQVSNWFINARVRLWKPMVEEIHSLEIRQQNKAGNTSDALDSTTPTDRQYSQHPSTSAATSSNDIPLPPVAKIESQSSKRPHDDLTEIINYNPFNDGFDVRGNGGVSLTLGLHQNNGICLTEQIPLTVAHQFGISLDECNNPYVMGSFGGQDHRQFEKEIGGHLLHDFVGEALL